MGITFTNNWKNIADKLRSTFRTEFKGALPVYINDENVSTGGQYLQLDLASTSLSEKMVGCELREYTVNISYIFQSPNVKKSSLDHILRYTSRIEQLMQNNISLSLTDSTTAVNCRIESTDLQEGEDNSYLVSFDWKCQHLSGLSEVIDTTPVLFYNTYSLNFDGSDDYVDIGDSNNFSFGDGSTDSEFSMSAWIKMDDATNFTIINKGVFNSDGEWNFRTNASDKLVIALYDESVSSTHQSKVSDATVTSHQGSWINVVATYNGVGGTSANGGLTLYLNGEVLASANTGAGTYVAMENLGGNVYIGKMSSNYANGNIDEVAIWNTALDADAVTAIYNSGTPISLSADSGDYDNSANLQGYWRMGDGTDLPYPFITDEKGTVGAELVVDGSSNWVGDFDVSGDISSWISTDSGELAISHDSSNNAIQLTGGSASSGKWVYYTATVEVGELYAVSVKLISRNDSNTVPNLRVGRTVGGTEYFNAYWTSFITQGTIFTASTNTTCIIAINVNGNDNDAGFDNISLKKVTGKTGLMTNMVSGDIEEDTP